MTTTAPSTREPDQRLEALIAEFFQARELGRPTDRKVLLSRYPELGSELEQFFAGHDYLSDWARPVREAVQLAFDSSGNLDPSEMSQLDTRIVKLTLPAPSPFGAYELLEEIGHG